VAEHLGHAARLVPRALLYRADEVSPR